MKILFWFFFGSVFWCYVGYPIAMRLRARGRDCQGKSCNSSKSVGAEDNAPGVSVVVAARNEAARIQDRVNNLLQQNYPSNRMEVIVVCNGCTDGTEDVVRTIAASGKSLRVLTSSAADGKAGALNHGVEEATGEIIIFADARQRFTPNTIQTLASRLSDPGIGAVSGRLVMEEADETALEGVRRYWEYETHLRRAESATGSVVGVTGAIYAVKRALFTRLPSGLILDDVYIPLRILQQGKRVVLEPDAIAIDIPSEDESAELRRRLRVALGNIQLLRLMPELLIPWKNPVFFRYLSHKFLRLASPVFVTGMMATGLVLEGVLYQGLALGLLAFCIVGVVGLLVSAPILSLPASFVLVHIALIDALIRPDRDPEKIWIR